METKDLVVLFLALIRGTCLCAITLEGPKQDGSIDHLVHAANNILMSCYGKQVKVVGVHDSTGILLGKQLSNTLPVISISRAPNLLHKQIEMREFRNKLEIFTILAGSPTDFHRILREIKNTPRWNHMASFLILNWSPDSNNDCSNAFKFLWIAWEINVLNAILLCVDSTNEVFLYSYNPYTKNAPHPWKLWSTFEGEDDHPWSMFLREYRKDEKLCEGLNFARTKDLGGYRIRSSVVDINAFWHTDLNKSGVASFGGLDGIAASTWFRVMNAEAKLSLHEINEPIISTNENGETIGLVTDLTNGTSDLVLNPYYFDELGNFTVAYPRLDGGLGIVTQVSRPISQLNKLNSVIGVTSRYGLYLIMIITPMLIKFFSRQTLMSAILDTIRVISNSGLARLPNNTGARIFLATLFAFQITILPLYQGQLASLLTKSVYDRNVDTMQDLAELGHTIYGHKSLAHLFKDPIFKNRFVGVDIHDCSEYVLRDSTIACVYDWEILRSAKPNPKLHLSSGRITDTSLVITVRKDWPLEQRFNEVIATTVENGILRRLYAPFSERFTKFSRYNEKLENQPSFRVIKLSELSFAFAFLGIGLGLATVVFIFEIIIG